MTRLQEVFHVQLQWRMRKFDVAILLVTAGRMQGDIEPLGFPAPEQTNF